MVKCLSLYKWIPSFKLSVFSPLCVYNHSWAHWCNQLAILWNKRNLSILALFRGFNMKLEFLCFVLIISMVILINGVAARKINEGILDPCKRPGGPPQVVQILRTIFLFQPWLLKSWWIIGSHDFTIPSH